MSADRELLEAAAKAAGLSLTEFAGPIELSPDGWGMVRFIGHGHVAFWNPLTDDGDALRLAVKLGIDVSQDQNTKCADASAPELAWLSEPYGADPCAATRRAIVRAAAAVWGLS